MVPAQKERDVMIRERKRVIIPGYEKAKRFLPKARKNAGKD